MKSSSEIRETFLSYFESQDHRRVASSSLVPENDPTLLFTNAGMNQFKDVFLGLEQRPYSRAASSQKCMRVSGKHNDLETVGRTPKHHTFFEMLGNFSFGDYFKKDAIDFAWELCTEVYGVPEESLRATVYKDDDEAYDLWKNRIGLPSDRIYRLGKADNFWSMGETGPCGPCSELHYDLGVSPAGHKDCAPDCDCGRYNEIWNLVFMQFNRDGTGETTPLPSPSIDTGMGLERLTSILQGVTSNYDTDLFVPIIRESEKLIGVPYGGGEKSDTSLRILADHSRACAFLIEDGVVPANEGRGYVLRKIMRRAIRHGKMLGREEPFLYTLTALVSGLMKDAYPGLLKSRDYAAKIVRNEEERFSETLSQGLGRLEELFETATKAGAKLLPGKDLFKLYDTFGFPMDLAHEIVHERGFEIDEQGFHDEMEKQRTRARASWKGGEKAVSKTYQELAKKGFETEFTGYQRLTNVSSRVLAIAHDDQILTSLEEGQTGSVVLDISPFYAEAGGQVGDQGTLLNDETTAAVLDTYNPISGLRLHSVRVHRGSLSTGDQVSASVQTKERSGTARNHTATHLLHAALREILGEHVKQAGSLVSPDRLRFDFTHYQSVSEGEVRQIEKLVNQKIRANIGLNISLRDLEDALREGAMALFGEKYQDQVRVVRIPGFSMELCGGTHVNRTGDIGLFKVLHESSISAGVRRIEAITGKGALDKFLEGQDILDRVGEQLQVPLDQLSETIERMAADLKQTRRNVEQLKLDLARKESQGAADDVREVAGVKVLTQRVENLDRNGLRVLAGQLKDQLQSGVVVLGLPIDGKVSLIAMVTSDLTDRISASEVIRSIAPTVKGGGGGRPEMAEAGGKDASQLDRALEQTYQVIEELMS
jgi:alanyl-tRNA synthetase